MALDVIDRAIGDAVYLDEDAYAQMVPLQQHARTIEARLFRFRSLLVDDNLLSLFEETGGLRSSVPPRFWFERQLWTGVFNRTMERVAEWGERRTGNPK